MSAPIATCKPYAPDAATGLVSNSPAQTARPNGQHNARALFTPHDAAHLQRLEAAIAVANERARRFHSLHEEEQMLMMRRPLTTEQAFRYFGLLLGLLPPAAILLKTLVVEAGDGPLSDSRLQTLVVTLLLGLAINSACALVGRIRGGKVARRIERAEYASWPRTLVVAFGSGAEWGVLTGACGGALFFFIGALFGVACALPVALVGFPLFTVCHRLLARGGMIDARHFWPVACGVAALLAALILSPGLIPY